MPWEVFGFIWKYMGEGRDTFEQILLDPSLAIVRRQDWEWQKRQDWRQGPVRGLFSNPRGESLELTAAVAILPRHLLYTVMYMIFNFPNFLTSPFLTGL